MKTAKRILAQILALVMVISTLSNVYATASATETLGEGFVTEDTQSAAAESALAEEAETGLVTLEAGDEEQTVPSIIEEAPADYINTDHPDGGSPGEVPATEYVGDQTGTYTEDPSVVIFEDEIPDTEETFDETFVEEEVIEDEIDTEEVNEIATTLVINYDSSVGGTVTVTSETIDLTSAYTIRGSKAEADKDHLFTGWFYEDGSLVSTEYEYAPAADMIDYIVYYGTPDENGVIEATFTAEFEEGEEVTDYTYVGTTLIKVRYISTAFDETVMLDAKEITKRDKEYAQVEAAIEQQIDDDLTADDVDFAAFDIFFVNGKDEEVEPKEGSFVAVSISMTGSETPDDANLILHIDDQKNIVEEIEADLTGDAVEFITDNFSIYIIADGLPARESKDGYKAHADVYAKGSGAGPLILGTQYVHKEAADVTFTSGDGAGASYKVHGYDTIYGVYFHNDEDGGYHKVTKWRLVDTQSGNNWRVVAQFSDGQEDVVYFNNANGESNVQHFAWLLDEPEIDERIPTGTIRANVYRLLNYIEVPPDIHRGWGASLFGPRNNNDPYFDVEINLDALNEMMTPYFSGGVFNGTEPHVYYTYIVHDGYANTPGITSEANRFFIEVLMNPAVMPNAADRAKFLDTFGPYGDGVNFIGYVLKRENDPEYRWHIDGIARNNPNYWLEIYEEGMTRPFATHASQEAASYEDEVKNRTSDYIQSQYGATVNWGEIKDDGSMDGIAVVNGQATAFHLYPLPNRLSSGTDSGINKADGKVTYEKLSDVSYLANFELSHEPATALVVEKKITVADGNSNAFAQAKENTYAFTVWNGQRELKFNDAGNGIYLYDANGTLTEMQIKGEGTVTLAGLPAGSYRVEETGKGNAIDKYDLTVDYSPRGGNITIANGRSETVTVTNRYDLSTGTLRVEKVFDGTYKQQGLDGAKDKLRLIIRDSKGNVYENVQYNRMSELTGGRTGRYIEFQDVVPGIYYVEESGADVSGYSLTTTGAGWDGRVELEPGKSATLTVTNKYERDTTEIEVEKQWQGTAKSATFRLKANGQAAKDVNGNDVAPITLNGTKTSGKFTNLPVRDLQNNVIDYTVEEDALDGYVSNGTHTGNKWTFVNTEMIDLEVKKVWDDENNKDGNRPAFVEVGLFENASDTTPVRTLKLEGIMTAAEWTDTFEKVPNTANYVVKEKSAVNGNWITSGAYNDKYTVTIAGRTVTNKHIPEKSISVKKVWNDNNNSDGKRPASVTVYLTANGVRQGAGVTLDASNAWQHTWTELPEKTAAGQAITYGVEEAPVPAGYTPATTGTGTAADPFVITNSYTNEKVDIEVVKNWDDNNDQDGVRPDAITVTLYANGKPQGDPVSVKASEGWKYTWTQLDKMANSDDIVYSVVESDISGYKQTKNERTVSADGKKITFTLENQYTPEETTVTVVKEWDDKDDQDGVRPDSVKAQLYADGTAVTSYTYKDRNGRDVTVQGEQTLNAANGWTYKWEGLDLKKDGGKEISYDVKESGLNREGKLPAKEGATYDVSYKKDGVITIVNTHKPEEIDLTVRKIWSDANDAKKLRPAQVRVQLFKQVGNGEATPVTDKAATLTGTNWEETFEKMPAKEDGKTITYSIREYAADASGTPTFALVEEGGKFNPAGYVASYGRNGNVLTVTNKYTYIPEDNPKEVSDNSPELRDAIDKAYLAALDEEFTFTIKTEIPVDEDLKSFVIEDEVESVLEVKNAEAVIDGTIKVTPVVNGNKVTVDLKDYISAQYQGKEVVLTILAKVAEGADISAYLETGIDNTAKVIIDGNDKPTNTVVVIPPEPEQPDMTKKVQGGDHYNLGSIHETFTYTLETNVPEHKTDLKSFVITDTLENVLDFDGTAVVTITKKGAANAETVANAAAVNGKTLTVTMPANYLQKAYYGAQIVVTFDAKIADTATAAELEAYKRDNNNRIPNKASYDINNGFWTKDSNEVTVTPPETKNPAITKQVDGGTHKNLSKWDQTFTYTLETEIPVRTGMKSFTIIDTLAEELELAAQNVSVTVTPADASKVATFESNQANGNAVTVDIPAAYLGAAYQGAKVTVTFDAKIKEGTSEAALIAKYGDDKKIPNEASYVIKQTDDSEETEKSNIVTVTPPDVDNPPFPKTVNDESQVNLKTWDEVVKYTLKTNIPQRADLNKFLITDTIKDVLVFDSNEEGTPFNAKLHVAVTIDGAEATQAVVTVNGKTLSVNLDAYTKAAFQGQEVVVEFYARVKEGVTTAEMAPYKTGTIDNKAQYKINDEKEVDSDVARITIPDDKNPAITKKVDGENHKNLSKWDDAFTYTIETQIPERADLAKFVVTDTLESVLEFASEVLVKINGNTAHNALIAKDDKNGTLEVDLSAYKTKAYQGQDVVITFGAKIKEGTTQEDLEKYAKAPYSTDGSVKIPNQAGYDINDDPELHKDSDRVTVTPPDPENPPFKKTVNDVQYYELKTWDETYTYKLVTNIPERADLNQFKITDTLEPVLTFEGNVKVIIKSEDGNTDIDASAKATTDGQLLTVDLDAYTARAFQGREVVVTFDARVRDGITVEDMEPYRTGIVDNKATYTINDKETQDSDVAKIRIPDSENPPLEKKVDGSNHKNLDKWSDVFTYTIETAIPDRADLTGFVVTDKLEDVLEFNGDVTVTIDGRAVADVAKTNGQELTVDLKDYLTKAFQGKTVVITFRANIAKGTTKEDLAFYTDKKIPNQASYDINNDPKEHKDSNVVTVTPPDPDNPPFKKTVNDEQYYELKTWDETVTYQLKVNIPERADLNQFKITDKLEPVLKFEGDVTVQIEGKTADKAAVTQDGQLLTVNLDAYTDKDFQGKEVVVTFDARVRDGITVEEMKPYRTGIVDNKAQYKINDEDDVDSDIAKIRIPDSENPPLEKKVDGENHKTLGRWDDVFTYTIETQIPEMADLETFIVTDKLEKVLVFASDVTVTIDGKDAEDADIATDNDTKTLTVDLSAYKAKADQGKTVVITFKAQIAAGTKEEELTVYPNKQIPNQASYDINNDPELHKDSNKVTVTPPTPEDPGMEKEVEGGTQYTLQEPEEPFTYTLTTKVPERADLETFIITDELADVLEFVGDATVYIGRVKAENAKVTQEGRLLTVDMEAYTGAEFQGKEVVVEFDAKVKKGANLAPYADKDIPNTGEYRINNKEGESNTVYVRPKDEVIDIPVVKEWDDAGDFDQIRPDYIDVTLFANGDKVDTRTLSKSNDYKYTFERMAKYANGEAIAYTVEENVPDGYEVEYVYPEKDADGNIDYTKGIEVHNVHNPKSIKKVNNADQVELVDRSQKFTYTIETAVPNGRNVTKFAIKDKVKPVLEVIGGVSGVSVSLPGAQVEISADNVVSVTFTGTALEDAKAQPVTVSFEARIIDGADLTPYLTAKGIENQAFVEINDNPGEETDIVSVQLPAPKISKAVNDSKIHEILKTADEVFEYTIKTQIPERGDMNSFIIEDTLVNELEMADDRPEAVTVFIAGKSVNAGVTLLRDTDGARIVEVDLPKTNIENDKGKEVIVAFDAKIKANADLSKYTVAPYSTDGRAMVPNTAYYTINLNPTVNGGARRVPTAGANQIVGTSNEVWVTPPEPTIVKTVNGGEHAELDKFDDDINYVITTQIPYRNVRSFVIKDTLKDALTFKGTQDDVQVTLGGQAVTGAARISGQELVVTLTGSNLEKLMGQEVRVSFTARVKEGANLVPYRTATGTIEVPNTARYQFDNNPEVESDPVTVTPKPEYMDIPVEKIWEDADNQDGVRPAQITFRLFTNGVETDSAIVRADATGTFTHTFRELLKYEENGTPVQYNVTEDYVTDYTAQVEEVRDEKGILTGVTVTNMHTPDERGISVIKGWADQANRYNTRPENVTVQLLADGVVTDTQVLSSANGWRHTWMGLPVNKEGTEINYTVQEVNVPNNYAVAVTGNMEQGYVITNTLESGQLRVVKQVEGLPAGTTRTYSFTITHASSGTVAARISITGSGSQTLTLPVGNYVVTEVNAGVSNVTRYTMVTTGSGDLVTVSANQTATATIVNTYRADPETPGNTPGGGTPGTGTPVTPIPVAPAAAAGDVLGVRRTTGDSGEAVLGARRGVTGDASTEKRSLMMVLSSAMALLATLASKKRRKDEA